MTTTRMASAIALAASLLLAIPGLHADDKSKDKKPEKAKNTVDNIRQADPPKESTGTQKSDPKEIAKRENAKEQERQKQDSPKHSPDHIKVPPPSTDRNNPNHDKDVQNGFDKNQKEHKDKGKPPGDRR